MPRSRIAIYTGIFGQSDRLLTQPSIPDVDFICFTDDPTATSDQWKVVVESPRYGHPTRSSRFHKILPHLVLPQYDYTIWIDANMELVTSSFVADVLEHLADAPLALFAHPDRGSVYEEAEFSAQLPKYAKEPNLEQVRHYRRQGLPDDTGLFACGVLARARGRRKLEAIAWPWMLENLLWSHLDQLSLPYLLWRYEVPRPTVFPFHLRHNPWFRILPHLTEPAVEVFT